MSVIPSHLTPEPLVNTKRAEPTPLEADVRERCRLLFADLRTLYPEMVYATEVIVFKNPKEIAASHVVFKAKGTQ